MSLQFRPRKTSEYLQAINRRKWLILLPTIAITVAVFVVAYRLPDVYESVTLIVVKPSTLPSGVVPTITEDSLTRQLTGIAQVVTSRSSLEPLVEKYELYKTERLRGEPMESIIDTMRKNIKVEVNTSRNDITNGFNITYRGRNPRITQGVTAELAGKYINEQTKNTVDSTNSAKQFIDQQVRQAKDDLDAIDKQRLDFMQKNVGNLPSEANALVGQLTGLREQQKALISEVGRLQDRSASLLTQLTLLKKQTQTDIEDYAENITDPKTTLAWAELVRRKAELQSELQHLMAELKPKHPDVIAKQAQLTAVTKEMDDLVAEWKEKIQEKQKKLQNRPDLSVAATEAQLKATDGEIRRQQKLLDENSKQIADMSQRINSIPGAEVALGAIEREYQTKKTSYDQLLQQQQKITLGADAASQQQGESIQVIDPANLPSQAVAPKRFLLSAAGLGVGLLLGLLLAAGFEIPGLLTIQNAEDARYYTGLPVLVSVAALLNPYEQAAISRRRRLMLAGAITATVLMTPLLALALTATHILEYLSSSSSA